EYLLRQLLSAVMITGSTADISVDLTIVATERTLGDVLHTLLLGHDGTKVTVPACRVDLPCGGVDRTAAPLVVRASGRAVGSRRLEQSLTETAGRGSGREPDEGEEADE